MTLIPFLTITQLENNNDDTVGHVGNPCHEQLSLNTKSALWGYLIVPCHEFDDIVPYTRTTQATSLNLELLLNSPRTWSRYMRIIVPTSSRVLRTYSQ